MLIKNFQIVHRCRSGGSTLLCLFALALFSGVPMSVLADSAASRAAEAPAPQTRPTLKGGTRTSPSFIARLPPLSSSDISALRDKNRQSKVYEVGIGRELPAQLGRIELADIYWHRAADKSQFATVEFTSAEATAIRLAIDGRSIPKGLQLIAYGTLRPESTHAVWASRATQSASRDDNLVWLPVIEGETVRLELRANGDTRFAGKSLVFPKLSHLLASITDSGNKNLNELGDSGSCNIDIACSASWVSTGQSVAKYYVTGPNGNTGICTGTLVNSNTTSTPFPNHFLTARHCVSTPSAASSMELYWFFQRAMCSGANPTSVTVQTGGATFITSVAANDTALVELNSAPPAGTIYAAWNTVTIPPSASVVGLHHPAGDVKKYSAGTVQGFSEYLSSTTSASGSHIRVIWNQGTAEGGSSGSGLFNQAAQLVGTLRGGYASCATPTQPDWYGRFEQAYPSLQAWLSSGTNPPPPPPPPPSPPAVIDLSSGVGVSGTVGVGDSTWYRITSTTAHASLTVTLSGLSEDADLYVYRDSQSGTLGCESELADTATDSCSIASPGNVTWYIEVYGYSAADYTLTATLSLPAPAIGRSGGGGEISILLLVLLSMATYLILARRSLIARRPRNV